VPELPRSSGLAEDLAIAGMVEEPPQPPADAVGARCDPRGAAEIPAV
jgi:hypothetical protein